MTQDGLSAEQVVPETPLYKQSMNGEDETCQSDQGISEECEPEMTSMSMSNMVWQSRADRAKVTRDRARQKKVCVI